MKSRTVLLLLVVAALLMSTILLFHTRAKIVGVETITASVTVGDRIGFDVSNESLTFGMVLPGQSSSSRIVEITNTHDVPLRVITTIHGDVKEWIDRTPSPFIVNVHSTGGITFVARPPTDTPFGNYTGTVRFVYEKT